MASLRLPPLALSLVCCLAPLASHAQDSVLDNGIVRIHLDLGRGGAIRHVSASGTGVNLVNVYDLGRFIQQSYYSGPDPYVPPGATQHSAYAGWGWNPVQAGDVYGYRSLVIEAENDGVTAYTKAVPRQWALRAVDCECTMETWAMLDSNRVHVRNRMVNARSDSTVYGARHQELPAVYTVGTLHRLFTYTGNEPFTGGALTQIVNSGPPWVYWNSTESWSALVNDEDWGLGVFTPGAVLTVGGFHGIPGSGGPTSVSTGYIAPLHTDRIDHDIVYDFTYTLVLGDLHDDIRAYAERHAPPPGPRWVFGVDRQHCVALNLTDASPPFDGAWQLHLDRNDPQVHGPPVHWKAVDVPRVFVTAAFETQSDVAEIFFARDGGGFTAEQRIPLHIVNDGGMRSYEVDLAAHPLYTGTITRLRLDPIAARAEGDVVRLRSITAEDPTSVPPLPGLAPDGLAITGVAPNPFNPRTTITFVVPRGTQASVDVHDVRGRRVRTLADGWWEAGAHHVVWDGRDEENAPVATGAYFVRVVTVDGRVRSAKVSLVK